MLVLTRKRIGEDVRICVVEVKGEAVRIGIEAPSHVAVDRGEVRLAKERRRSGEF